MSRKDYVAIADIVRELTHDGRIDAAILAGALAGYFAADNPNFDRSHFLRAAGL